MDAQSDRKIIDRNGSNLYANILVRLRRFLSDPTGTVHVANWHPE